MPSFLPLPFLVFLPESAGFIDVGLLALFGASSQQDHKLLSVPAKITAVSGTEIQT
jgi:hypothetical protein